MTMEFACDCMYMCKFIGRNFFRRGECKTWEKFNFSKTGNTVICRYSTSGIFANFLDLG